jgi:DNA invertase Pin-like site-specific DNA recombinase
MQVGYGRISTAEQRLDLQIEALTQAGCQKIFTDTVSGVRVDRPGLREALNYCRSGDVLTVWRLDRLGRSLPDLLSIVKQLEQSEIGFHSLTEAINTNTPGGKLAFHLFGSLAEFERALIRDRTRAGLEAARQRGRFGGRPTKLMTAEKVDAAMKLLRDGTPPKDIAHILGISLPTFYRHVSTRP